MSAAPTLALMANDARLHLWSVLAAHAAAILLLATAVWLSPPERQQALLPLVLNLNLLAALVWADWLVSREKVKGTVAWLRTLPVSDAEIVGAKFATQAICSQAFWVVTSLPMLHDQFWPSNVAAWWVIGLALVTFGAVAVAARWRFSQKVGYVAPLGVALGFIVPVVVAARAGVDIEGRAVALWQTATGPWLLTLVLFLIWIGLVWMTARFVAGCDTPRLVE